MSHAFIYFGFHTYILGGRLVGWIRHSLGKFAGKTHFLSPVTSLLALLTLKLPGLIPLLDSSETPPVPSSFNQRLLQVARRRAAALKTAVFAIGASAIMVAAAFAGMPDTVHTSLPSSTPAGAAALDIHLT